MKRENFERAKEIVEITKELRGDIMSVKDLDTTLRNVHIHDGRNKVWIKSEYQPISTKSFVETYIRNIENKIEMLEKEFETL
jgi:hypothetical protein